MDGAVARPALLAAAVALLAVNLRAPIASLPPLVADVERALGLGGAAVGALTALPVLCMGFFAPAAHRLAHRFGREAAAAGALALIAAGCGLRALGAEAVPLFAGTLLAGIGIAICGVVLPAIVKERFPGRAGAATGAYLVPMVLGASVASAAAVPLADALGGWAPALAVWAVPPLLALALWVPLAHAQRGVVETVHSGRLPWRRRPAWLLVALFALQGALFYGYLAWLAPAYEDRGWSPEAAGALLGAFNLAQLGAVLVLPAVTDRSNDRRPVLLGAVAATGLGALGLAADVVPWVAAPLVGFGLGGGFSLALVLLVDVGASPGAASRLTALVFLASYPVGAAAPILLGALRDATDGFGLPFALLAGAAAVQLAVAAQLGPRLRGTVR